MRKVIIIIAVVLLLGITGCKSFQATQEEINIIDVANACNIATAINEYDANIKDVPFPDDTTLDDAKETMKMLFWPVGLSAGEEKAAWKLIELKEGEANLIPEAQEVLQGLARDAYGIALAINWSNACYPSSPLEPDTTLEDAKERIGEYLWPAGLSDEEERAAWELIVYVDYEADLTPEVQQAFQEGSGDESDQVKIANATMIAKGINVYNTLNPVSVLPDDVTLAEVKEILGEKGPWPKVGLWPSLLIEAEVNKAWELIEIKDGLAKVKE